MVTGSREGVLYASNMMVLMAFSLAIGAELLRPTAQPRKVVGLLVVRLGSHVDGCGQLVLCHLERLLGVVAGLHHDGQRRVAHVDDHALTCRKRVRLVRVVMHVDVLTL